MFKLLCELVRKMQVGSQGAALLNIDLISLEDDEYMIVESCCLENQDAANTIATRIGVLKDALFYPHKTDAALAAGASLEIDREIIVGPNETLRVGITPSGAATEYTLSVMARKYYKRDLDAWRTNQGS